MREASSILGPVRAEITARTGLARECKVLCGTTDRSAALLATLGHNIVDLTVVATGRWFSAMRAGGGLDEADGCFVNIDVQGRPVPSAHFMGGHELELAVSADYDPRNLLDSLPRLIAKGAMFAPGVDSLPSSRGLEDRRAVTELHLALRTDRSLNLVGSEGNIVIQGRFAEAVVFTRALATLRRNQRVFAGSAQHDVAYGALRLLDSKFPARSPPELVAPLDLDLARYAAEWQFNAPTSTKSMAERPIAIGRSPSGISQSRDALSHRA
jgi:hypothetical protein